MITRAQFMDAVPKLQKVLDPESPGIQQVIEQAEAQNPWFIPAFTKEAIHAIRDRYLDEMKFWNWISKYPETNPHRRIALVMAGNIPLVGFHDLLCVLAAGHEAVVKMSEKDAVLLPYLVQQWDEILPGLTDQIHFVDKLSKMDAVIATGSNNSLRYFEYYFQKYPHLFRHNRNGVAVLNGRETVDELRQLAFDIFLFFGLGCRNVAKMYVPEGYDFSRWSEAISDWRFLADQHKYKNNLDYNHAIYLVNLVAHLHLGHLIVKEDAHIASRIGCVHYQYYRGQDQLQQWLTEHQDEIQCVVSQQSIAGWDHIKFGNSQQPELDQYADGVDIMQFLTQLSA